MVTEQMLDLFEPQNLAKALLYLYGCQTQEEQAAEQTVENNGRGFNALDAEFMSSVARWILDGKPFTSGQQAAVSKVIRKYARQLQDGSWMSIQLPVVQAQPVKEKSPYKGELTLDTGGRLVFHPHVYPSKQIKDLAPFGWDAVSKSWVGYRPGANRQLVSDICKMFGDVLVAPEVTAATEPKTVVLPEEVANHSQLFPFQKETVHFALSNPQSMICLAPGLGKTACSIFAAQAAEAKRILIIAPLSLVFNWRNEITKWIGEKAAVVHGKNLLTQDRWTITNYDSVRLQKEKFLSTKWDCIIVDESICIKNRKAARTKSVQALIWAVRPQHCWLLSGAPTSRLMDDMWAQLHTLNPSRFSSYWRFAERYCHVEQDQWGWHILANKEGAQSQLKQDLEDIYFARTQDQVLDLPDWIIEDIAVPMAPEQEKLYLQMEDEFLADLPDGEELLAPNVLSQLTRLVQLASNPALVGSVDVSPKRDAVLEMLSYEQLPVIVWTSFIKTAELLETALAGKYRVARLNGSVPDQERQKIVDAFQRGELDVLIAHPAVGKFGFTLTAARTAIYMERNYNADDYYQSLHRIRRIGTTQSPHVLHLISETASGGATVDWVIAKVLEGRRENVLALTAGEIRSHFGR